MMNKKSLWLLKNGNFTITNNTRAMDSSMCERIKQALKQLYKIETKPFQYKLFRPVSTKDIRNSVKEVLELNKYIQPNYRDVVLVIHHLNDLSLNPSAAMNLLEELNSRFCKVFIASVSLASCYSDYREEFRSFYANEIMEQTDIAYQRRPKYNHQLFEAAANLRRRQPPVSFVDICEITGIPKTTLRDHLKKYYPDVPVTGNNNTRLSDKEIQSLKNEYSSLK